MMNNTSVLEAGDVVEVAGGPKLPFGLTEGFQVRLVRRLDSARRLVERDGQEWILDASQIRPRAARRPALPGHGDGAPVRAVRPHVPSRRAMMPAMAWR